MISYLRGTLLDKSESCTVLTAGGVGYLLHVPTPVLQGLPEPGADVDFYVQTVVKDEAIELYGFATPQEQKTFNLLVSVSKLGPKTALAMLSTFDPRTLEDVIVNEDTASLSRVPGIGPKSAKRIIWELKEKIAGVAVGQWESDEEGAKISSIYSDALAGLINLGYSDAEVRPVLKRILHEDPGLMVGEAIRAVLKSMSKS